MAGSYFSSDTIAAIATSLAGDAGVGIIRLSGSKALIAAQSVCREFAEPKPRYLHRIEVLRPTSGEVLDDGLGVWFPSGQSFTGEDVVELQLHGGRFLLQSILNLLIESGNCRLALPGEFSFRAVRNGKLSLGGAEALGQVINARSTFEIQAARRRLSSKRVGEFEELAASIRELLAQMELSIDFIDQDVEVISAKDAAKNVAKMIASVDTLLEKMRAAQHLARGLAVTLVGVPNAGKSTLFNALLSEDRAIVSAEAGTTRDVITEDFSLGPYRIRLADTAGIRTTTGIVEIEGIGRAKSLAVESDLVVLVVDASLGKEHCVGQLEEAKAVFNEVSVVVLNKWDLVKEESRGQLLSAVDENGHGAVLPLSALDGNGVTSLLREIRTLLDGRFSAGLNHILPTEFQLQMVVECRMALVQALELIQASGLEHPELISASLSSAVRALSDLVGETTPDTVLAKIFSEFCIGK